MRDESSTHLLTQNQVFRIYLGIFLVFKNNNSKFASRVHDLSSHMQQLGLQYQAGIYSHLLSGPEAQFDICWLLQRYQNRCGETTVFLKDTGVIKEKLCKGTQSCDNQSTSPANVYKNNEKPCFLHWDDEKSTMRIRPHTCKPHVDPCFLSHLR